MRNNAACPGRGARVPLTRKALSVYVSLESIEISEPRASGTDGQISRRSCADIARGNRPRISRFCTYLALYLSISLSCMCVCVYQCARFTMTIGRTGSIRINANVSRIIARTFARARRIIFGKGENTNISRIAYRDLVAAWFPYVLASREPYHCATLVTRLASLARAKRPKWSDNRK